MTNHHTTTTGDLVDVRHALVGGIARTQARSRGRRRVGVGLAVAVLAVAAPVTVELSSSEGVAVKPALAIANTDASTIRVRVLDASADPEGMEQQLRDAGIDADVEALPVSESLEGTLVGFESSADRHAATADEFSSYVELEVGGTYWLAVGRQAGATERYMVAKDPTTAGEPLHCRAALGMSLTAARDAVEAAGLTPVWRHETIAGGGNGAEGRSDPVENPKAGAVTGYAALDPETVVVFVDPTALPDPAASSGC